MYTDLLKNPKFYEIKYPQTIVPNPSEAEYAVGFIVRYFVRKSNDPNGYVFEVDEDVYTAFVSENNPFWVAESLKWRISGPKTKTTNELGNVTDVGVMNANKSAIALASVKIKNIKLYLPNLLQFHRV
jgi:hypothetical protein